MSGLATRRAQFAADQQRRTLEQEAINQAGARVRYVIADAIRREGRSVGHEGDEWRIGRMRRTVKTELGVAFVKGDIVLWRPELDRRMGSVPIEGWEATAYSVRNAADTALRRADVHPLRADFISWQERRGGSWSRVHRTWDGTKTLCGKPVPDAYREKRGEVATEPVCGNCERLFAGEARGFYPGKRAPTSGPGRVT